MYLTDEAGLRFQARNAVAMVVANVVLSVLLAREVGALGPVLGTVISMSLITATPNLVRAHRLVDGRREREARREVTAAGRLSVPSLSTAGAVHARRAGAGVGLVVQDRPDIPMRRP